MAPPRYRPHDPYVGAMHELAAAAASLSGDEIQPEHARDHVVCALELVKRAHHLVLDAATQPDPEPPPAPREVRVTRLLTGGTVYAWLADQAANDDAGEWVEVVW